MKKTVHIIYPFDLKKKINPWSIGNNIYYALKDQYNVKTYTWTSLEKIYPKKNDILIGHCHTNPLTIFRRSVSSKNWYKKILLQPFNGDIKQMSHLYDLIPLCDEFIAICGTYWMRYLNKSLFKIWKKKITQIDLGLDPKQYPFIKKKFNKSGKRKFLYIGNDYSYNNFAKNLNYLKLVSEKIGTSDFGTIGNKKIGEISHHGWIDFKNKKKLKLISKYDFLIHTSKHDANPSTVLEAMSWGLIPVLTKQCGYEGLDYKTYIPLNNLSVVEKKLKYLQRLNEKKLKKIQEKNIKILKKKYNWLNFRKTIRTVINRKKNNLKIKYTKKQIEFFENNKKTSPNYYLRHEILFSIIKTNVRLLLNKII